MEADKATKAAASAAAAAEASGLCGGPCVGLFGGLLGGLLVRLLGGLRLWPGWRVWLAPFKTDLIEGIQSL